MTIIYFILVLSITIFVHELGHFIFAKRSGIYVYEFCIGMGPRIFKFKRKNDETEYGIRLFPIGGFCSMAGESVEIDESVPKEKRMQEKTWTERFLTVIAGVMFNFLFALLILFIVGCLQGNPNNRPTIGEVSKDSPAFVAGLETGMTIEKINGVKIGTIDRFMIEFQVNYGNDLEIETSSGKKVTIVPKKVEEGYLYGFAFDDTIDKGFFPAIEYAFSKFASLVSQLFVTLTYLFTGKLSLNNLSGPIGIFNIVGESAKAGFVSVIYLIGYLSINVGFINLLPIPAFDGGRIFFLFVEKIRKKPVSPTFENTVHSIGFLLLMILMIVITYNDIIRFILP